MDLVALIHECEERLAQAVNRGDLDAIVDLHTEDCWVLAPGQPLTRGTEAVRAAFEEPLQMGARNCRFFSEEIVSSGEAAYHVGRFTFDADGENSEEITLNGKYVDGYQLNDGTCKIRATSFSFDSE